MPSRASRSTISCIAKCSRQTVSRSRAQRAEDEKSSEFLASTDHWFRPVQARTGPDGALYVVDMYRFLIEHPRWIAADRLAKIDVRAGAEMGRIYRVVPKLGLVDDVNIQHPTSNIQHPTVRTIRDLTKLGVAELTAAIDTPNGTERDRVHLELLARADKGAGEALVKIAQASACLKRACKRFARWMGCAP